MDRALAPVAGENRGAAELGVLLGHPSSARPTLVLRLLAGAEREREVGAARRGVRDAGYPAHLPHFSTRLR